MLNTERIFPLTDFVRKHSEHVRRITDEQEPELLTVNGKAAVIVQDHASWQQLMRDAERARTADAIREGIAAAERGELAPADEVFARVRQQVERTARPRSARSK